MEIYDWDMKIKVVDKSVKDYYTANKIYIVRNGKIILDKEHKSQDKTFSLDDFLEKWQGNWTITRVKINDNWYSLEQQNL